MFTVKSFDDQNVYSAKTADEIALWFDVMARQAPAARRFKLYRNDELVGVFDVGRSGVQRVS